VAQSLLAGTAVERIVAPADLTEASATLVDAARRGDAVAFAGGGTQLGFGYPPERVDLLVKTEHLWRVVEYSPADLVVEVEAGVTLAALQSTLEAHGQRFALDAPQGELATLGGLVATNAYGPRRARYGSLRDLIVGISLIRADGTRIRGGGKVVKNVAGFDLPKLAVGSLGALGMIATATFRVHPLPETAVAMRVSGCSTATVRTIVREIVRRRLEPAALLATARGHGRYLVHALFEGFAAGVAEQAERFGQAAAELRLVSERIDNASRLLGVLDEAARTYGNIRMRFAVPPADLERFEAVALAPLASVLGDAKVALYPSLGIAFFSAFADARTDWAGAVLRARAALEALGGNAVLLDVREPGFAKHIDVYGTPPPALALMKRLKQRFDPERRLNRGRSIGRL